jgi:hypothetical protein
MKNEIDKANLYKEAKIRLSELKPLPDGELTFEFEGTTQTVYFDKIGDSGWNNLRMNR